MNWKVRIKNKTFWITLVPMLFLLLQQVLAVFGISYDGTELSTMLVGIIGTLFAILALIGVVADPTTEGVGDSVKAMTYEKPWSDKDIHE